MQVTPDHKAKKALVGRNIWRLALYSCSTLVLTACTSKGAPQPDKKASEAVPKTEFSDSRAAAKSEAAGLLRLYEVSGLPDISSCEFGFAKGSTTPLWNCGTTRVLYSDGFPGDRPFGPQDLPYPLSAAEINWVAHDFPDALHSRIQKSELVNHKPGQLSTDFKVYAHRPRPGHDPLPYWIWATWAWQHGERSLHTRALETATTVTDLHCEGRCTMPELVRLNLALSLSDHADSAVHVGRWPVARRKAEAALAVVELGTPSLYSGPQLSELVRRRSETSLRRVELETKYGVFLDGELPTLPAERERFLVLSLMRIDKVGELGPHATHLLALTKENPGALIEQLNENASLGLSTKFGGPFTVADAVVWTFEAAMGRDFGGSKREPGAGQAELRKWWTQEKVIRGL